MIKTLQELRDDLEGFRTQLRGIDAEAGENVLTEDQQTRWDGITRSVEETETKIRSEEARTERRSSLAAAGRTTEVVSERGGGPEVIIKRTESVQDVIEDRSLSGAKRVSQVRSALLKANEDRIEGREEQAYFEKLLKRHGGNESWAVNLLARSSDAYLSGFSKALTGREMLLDNEERAAMAVGTNTAGGFLVPTHLDPTLLLTNAGSSNALRNNPNTRKVTLTEGSVWNGATTAGVTGSWDGELVEVSDDSPSVARESITVHTGKAFVQASIQAFADIPGLQSDVLMLFADARDTMEGAAHAVGTGSGQPLGLFTAINASASLRVTSTTAATIGEVDISALYRAVPQRFRGRGTFVANSLYTLAVKRLGTAVSSAYSGDLTMPVSDRWLGRPVLETDDAPATQTTTTLDQEIVFADLSQFVIVDKPGGTSVEFIPQMFNTANNLPDGRRGWVMYFRGGSGMPVLNAGRVLVDKTSA